MLLKRFGSKCIINFLMEYFLEYFFFNHLTETKTSFLHLIPSNRGVQVVSLQDSKEEVRQLMGLRGGAEKKQASLQGQACVPSSRSGNENHKKKAGAECVVDCACGCWEDELSLWGKVKCFGAGSVFLFLQGCVNSTAWGK